MTQNLSHDMSFPLKDITLQQRARLEELRDLFGRVAQKSPFAPVHYLTRTSKPHKHFEDPDGTSSVHIVAEKAYQHLCEETGYAGQLVNYFSFLSAKEGKTVTQYMQDKYNLADNPADDMKPDVALGEHGQPLTADQARKLIYDVVSYAAFDRYEQEIRFTRKPSYRNVYPDNRPGTDEIAIPMEMAAAQLYSDKSECGRALVNYCVSAAADRGQKLDDFVRGLTAPPKPAPLLSWLRGPVGLSRVG